MTPDPLVRARALFFELVDLAPADRASVLDRACADDADLRARVERLLAKDGEPHPLDDAPLAGVIVDVAEALPDSIGRYRVVRLLGEGGMGSVYEAIEPGSARPVALKVLRPAYATNEGLARFRREARVLGVLRDPCIAQLHEAGEGDLVRGGTPVGRVHYFAMELVRGETLTQIVARRALSPRAALDLFARVCDAVHHAHQRGVVHRDLKPSNILVLEAGSSADESIAGRFTPKVLDFGVARLVEAGSQASLATRTGALIGTLAYMSPEQARGELANVDARSDVWSLGVVLYEMLAGHRPFQVDGLPIAAAVLAITRDDPPRLSSVDARWRGDLDTIVAKALEKERAERYETAAALGADVRRHLTREPIGAKPPSRLAELRKLARRNRALVVGASAVIASLGVGLALALVFAFQADRARRAAAESAYVANVMAAESAFAAHDPFVAREHLARVPVERRASFEYECLAAQLDTSELVLDLGSPALALALSDDARSLAVACRDGAVRIVPADLGGVAAEIGTRGAPATSVDFDARAARVAIAHEDGLVEVVDLATSERTSFPAAALAPPQTAWSPQRVHVLFDDARGRLLVRSPALGSAFVDARTHAALVTRAETVGTGPVVHDPQADVFHVVREFCVDSIVPTSFEAVVDRLLHRQRIHAIALSPDGARLATAGEDRLVMIASATGTDVAAILRGHSAPVLACAWSPDGTRLVSASNDGIALVWDVAGRAIATSFAAGEGAVRGATFVAASADGARPERIVTCGDDGLVRARRSDFDPASAVLRGHSSYVYDAAVAGDGATIVSASWDHTVRTWDARSGAQRTVADLGSPVSAVALTPDARVVCATKELQLRLLDPSRTRVEREIAPTPGMLERLRVSPDGAWLAGEDGYAAVSVFELATGARSPEREVGGRLCTGGSGPILCVRRIEGGIVLWDVLASRPRRTLAGDVGEPCAAAVSADGELVAAGDGEGFVAVWRTADGALAAKFRAHLSRIHALAFDPSGARIATGAGDDAPRVWDVQTGVRCLALAGHGDYVKSLAFTPVTRELVSASGDGTLRIWRRASAAASGSTR